MGKDRHGANGADAVLKVPVGTQIFEEDGETLLADLTEAGERAVLARGGNGGFGNAHFKTSTNRAPRHANPGQPGTELTIRLRLKLIADAGIVGLPNAGKSTFLAAVSAAKPKIADYPFTTLHPQLGVVDVDGREFVLADIPGLIEGAHEGVGLGDRFLGHVERCRVLLHLVDGTGEDAGVAYKTVRAELAAYGHDLAEKPEIVALSKADAMSDDDIKQQVARLKRAAKKTPLVISAVSGEGIPDALRAVLKVIEESTPRRHRAEHCRRGLAALIDQNGFTRRYPSASEQLTAILPGLHLETGKTSAMRPARCAAASRSPTPNTRSSPPWCRPSVRRACAIDRRLRRPCWLRPRARSRLRATRHCRPRECAPGRRPAPRLRHRQPRQDAVLGCQHQRAAQRNFLERPVEPRPDREPRAGDVLLR